MNSLLSIIPQKSSRTFYFVLILPLSLCLILFFSGCNLDDPIYGADNPYNYYDGNPNSGIFIPYGNSLYISEADVSISFIGILENNLINSETGTISGYAKVRVQLNYGTFRDNVVLFVNSTPYSYQFMYNNSIYLLEVKNLVFENNNYSLVISFIENSSYRLQ